MVTKKKIQEVRKKQTQRNRAAHPADVSSPRSARLEQQKQFWKSEITALLTERFESLDSAVLALIDRVIARVGKSKKLDSAEREFLHSMLKTDPEIRSLLMRTLTIRS